MEKIFPRFNIDKCLLFLISVLFSVCLNNIFAQENWTATSVTNAPDGRMYHPVISTGNKMILWGGYNYTGTALYTGGIYDTATNIWTTITSLNAPTGRYNHTAVWTGSKMIIWGGCGSGGSTYFNDGFNFDTSNIWTPISTVYAPSGRYVHTAIWTGSKMIIWGGAGNGIYNTGGIYNAATNSWDSISAVNAPTGRCNHTAVWTGSKMIIWGGWNSGYLNTGGIYDPSANTWTAISTVNAPSVRRFHTAVWTGSKMVIWGGYNGTTLLNTGGVYDPLTDTWTSTSTVNAHPATESFTTIWTGAKMIVWGGNTWAGFLNSGNIYDVATDTWSPISTTNAPVSRYRHSAVWTGSKMIIWSGWNGSAFVNTGGSYINTSVFPTPAVPTLISPINGEISISITPIMVWSKPQYATGYNLVLATDSSFTTIVINDSLLIDTIKVLSNLAPLTNYYWKVRAKNSAGNSAFSSVNKFKTLGVPTQVVLNSPSNNSINQSINITFKWNKAIDQTLFKSAEKQSSIFLSDYSPLTVSKYWMEYSLDSTFTNSVIRDTLLTDTLKVVNALNLGTKYYWRVKALNQSGWGSFSDKWNFTTIIFIDSVSPGKNKLNVPLTSNMNVWFHQATNSSTIDSNSVTFFGSMTGRKRGAITYNSGNNNMQVVPNSQFKYGEIVSTTLDSGIKTGTGIPIIPLVWSFNTKSKPSNNVYNHTNLIRAFGYPGSIVPGDFDGDGNIDLVTSKLNESAFTFLRNTGSGNFVATDVGPANYCAGITAGDYDSDGDLDVAVTTASTGGLVTIFKNNGAGSFTSSLTALVGSYPYDIVTGDFNGDGNLDLAVTNQNSNTVSILLNDGSGSFTVFSTTTVGNAPYGIGIGDFNSDGSLDLAVANINSNSVSVLINNGSGLFTASSSISVMSNPYGITVGDFDSNGSPDISVGNQTSGTVSILLNNGTGIFTVTSNIGVGTGPRGITNGDFDGDGDLDIAITNNISAATVKILNNNGTGSFSVISSVGIRRFPHGLTNGDFNNDGVLDIAVAGYLADSVSILINLSAPQLVWPSNNSTGNLSSFDFSWIKMQGASNYKLQVSTDSLFSNLVVNDSTLLGTDSVETVSGLSPLTWYYWRMNSKSGNGNSLWSDTWKFKTMGTPAQVMLMQPANNSVNQPTNVTFKWTKAIDQTLSIQNPSLIIRNDKTERNKLFLNDSPFSISNYWFEYSTDSTFATINARDSSLTDTTKTISGLNYITKYYWRVKAKNQTGWGVFSSVWNFTTVPNVPNVPSLISPPDNEVDLSLTPELNWTDEPYAASYRVQVSTSNTFGTTVYDSAGLTVSQITVPAGKLTTSTVYYWRVNATNISGTSSFTNAWNFTTAPNVPNVPVLSFPENNAANQPTSITFRWFKAVETLLDSKLLKNTIDEGPSPDVISKYWLEYGTDSAFAVITGRDSTLTDTTKAVTGLSTGTSYYWRVKAKNQTGWGGFSARFKFTTLVPTLSLNLKVYLEGFWNGTTQISDTVTVYLANSTTPYAFVDTAKVVLNATGQASMNFNRVTTGSYFIVVNHRNHLETWSKNPLSFVGGTPLSYDFTTAMTQAYGDNMKQVGSVWVLFGGDANADGSIDANDIGIFITEFGNLGYLRSDFNGDQDVNAADVIIISNNFGFIKIVPGADPLPPETVKNKKKELDDAIKSGKDIKKIMIEGKKVTTDKINKGKK